MKRTIDSIYNELEARLRDAKPLCKNGSCGFVAWCVAEFLDRQEVDHEIHIFDFLHFKRIYVMVKVPLGYIDKRGIGEAIFYRLMPYTTRVVSKDELKKLVDDERLWNPRFNTTYKEAIRVLILGEPLIIHK